MNASTRHLVELAQQTTFASLSTNDVQQCKRRLIDTFACATGSYEHPLSVSMRELATQYSGSPNAGVWGGPLRTTPDMAAFVNGVMLRVGENSDTFIGRGGGGHPSDMMSAIVSVADSEGASGESLISALVLAYDVYCRLMDTVNLGAKGWDQVVHVVLGSVLGVGQLMKLDPEQLGHAISLALTPNMALRQTRHGELSSWKGCAGANAARNAVFAATLARCGVEGPSDIFAGKQGLWSAVGKFDWPSLEEFRSEHMITRTSIKSLPVCYHTQAAALAALGIRGDLNLEQIESIEVQTYQTAVEMAGADPTQWAPRTSESADHSLPFVVATALVRGVVDASCFAIDRLEDPEVMGLVAKICVSDEPVLSAMWPDTAPARLVIRLSTGEVLRGEVLYPKGHIRNPMSDQELSEKFKAMFEIRAGYERCERALHELWQIDKSASRVGNVLETLIVKSG